MGRHSRRGPAPKSAGTEDTGERVPPARSRPPAPPTADGTPARGLPLFPDGTPAHGIPRSGDGTPAHGVPRVRGGHPEQRESGGGWGVLRGPTTDGVGYGRFGGQAQGPSIPRQRQAPARGPRQDYLDAFTADDDVFAPRTAVSALATDPYAPAVDRATAPRRTGTDGGTGTGTGIDVDDDEAPPAGEPTREKSTKSRAFTGIAAAAVTTVLAVVVAGQVAGGQDESEGLRSQSAAGQAGVSLPSAPSVVPSPSASADVVPLTYAQKMAVKYPLSPTLKGSGKFDAVPGFAKAPGKGRKYTYRVDVEQGLGLDGELFAQAVQKTLNDNRSWAHDGARTFERIHSGRPDFVITLASPGTTADWCAKSGLDTTEDNVSCDSAATERVMINAYRWAQGSTTYGDAIHAYRQMLINHEVGHRLGHSHVTCQKDGGLAPVMQQQTKFLDHDGIRCRPNPWAYPSS
ncbi:DUF3152 domain-containing protein [Streptomyces sp. NPDC059582]|uniref:DUF3152 domain-containing protein n=1 Tax=Streptomyces sp. NPDC059582 TaxID=3346875 RepID=UPI0036AAF9F3